MKSVNQWFLFFLVGIVFNACDAPTKQFPLLGNWERPVEEPVFSMVHGNNHDPILFIDSLNEYTYYIIICGKACDAVDSGAAHTFLWKSNKWSWNSKDWKLVSDQYHIGCQYEYDDGVEVDGKFFIYEDGIVYTSERSLEESGGKWLQEGTFPVDLCDDVGVYYEEGLFHLFGEFGHFPHGPDGTSLSHFVSHTGLGEWRLIDSLAVNPNIEGGNVYGVGDPTIIKENDYYYLYCDLESEGTPYKISSWRTKDLNMPFQMIGLAAEARKGTKNWDNYRVQDPEVAYIPEIGKYVMFCNMRDDDGVPGGHFPSLEKKGFTRVVGSLEAETNAPRE